MFISQEYRNSLKIRGYVRRSELRQFDPAEVTNDFRPGVSAEELQNLGPRLQQASRPVVIAGNGIRLSNTIPAFRAFIEKHQIPFVVSYLAVDLLPSGHPLYVGRMGIKGDRAGNFAVQNSDPVLALGTRLCVPMTGYEYNLFARQAKVVVVDIDPVEHRKNTVRIDRLLNAPLQSFFRDDEAPAPLPEQLPQFSVIQLSSTHFNPIVIWQDWRGGGKEVSNWPWTLFDRAPQSARTSPKGRNDRPGLKLPSMGSSADRTDCPLAD